MWNRALTAAPYPSGPRPSGTKKGAASPKARDASLGVVRRKGAGQFPRWMIADWISMYCWVASRKTWMLIDGSVSA